MIDNQEFIRDSLFCEYGYIINLDTNKLEFWRGFQSEPDLNNRYGTSPYGENSNYYPCKLLHEFDLLCMAKKGKVIEVMEKLVNQDRK